MPHPAADRPVPQIPQPDRSTSVPASKVEVGQSLLMNGTWREVQDIILPDDPQDDLQLVLKPNLPGTRFLRISPAKPVQVRSGHA